MLKTLRVTSIIAVVLAVCGTVATFFMGLKGNPEVKAFLDSPGVVDRFKAKGTKPTEKADKTPPLVAQAHEFALRIDPPPPPKPPAPKPKTPTKVNRTAPPKPVIPTPKVPVTVKSNLLATVLYKSAPEKSLALLATTGGKQEWFRQGETVGHLEIKEIRDGSVVFTQGGRNPEEKFVPAKPTTKSLLKKDQEKAALPPAGVAVQLPTSTGGPGVQTGGVSLQTGDRTESDNSSRVPRPPDRTSRSRRDISSRIQRIRAVPTKPEPSPQEQKQMLENTISGIEDIMNRDDKSISEEDREKEKEIWMELMKKLNAEKKNLTEAIEEKDKSEDSAPQEDAKIQQSDKKDAETKADDKGKPAASDPNASE